MLGTAALETGSSFATDQKEGLNYSAEALRALYPHRISAEGQRTRRAHRRPPGGGFNLGSPTSSMAAAWGRANLGNQQPDDGWTFRGRSWVQITGRRNYSRADNALGLGGALLAEPDLIARTDVCAGSAVNGMIQGWFTTKRFADYLPDHGPASLDQFTQARRIINGQDRAHDIADFALKFQSGLTAGGWR